jgi:hypothetical protein
MPFAASFGRDVSSVSTIPRQTKPGQTFQAWCILSVRGTSHVSAQDHPVDRRATAGLQIRLVPHRCVVACCQAFLARSRIGTRGLLQRGQ